MWEGRVLWEPRCSEQRRKGVLLANVLPDYVIMPLTTVPVPSNRSVGTRDMAAAAGELLRLLMLALSWQLA